MAETHPKRHREEYQQSEPDPETSKRHRNSYINEQQETAQDLSDFFTNFSSDPFIDFIQQSEPDPDDSSSSNPSAKEELIDDDDEKERVIRHLLEASDDELGIPSRVDGGDGGGGDDEIAGGDFSLDLCDGLWELEDEAANYYTLLQSELFME